MNVSLTKQQRAYVDAKVKTGRYGSRSEVVREALRVLEQLELASGAIEDALDEADLEPAIDVKNPKKFFKELWSEVDAEAKRRKQTAA